VTMCCSVLQCVLYCVVEYVDTTMQCYVSQLSNEGCANSESTVRHHVATCGNMC